MKLRYFLLGLVVPAMMICCDKPVDEPVDDGPKPKPEVPTPTPTPTPTPEVELAPEIKSGDLIICEVVDAEDVKVRDVIAFFDPAGNGTSVVTHRVIDITEKDGQILFTTQGDANNTEDKKPVPGDKLVGTYRSRIGGVGHVIMFMQTTEGLLLCVVLPAVLLIGYDMIRRKKFDKAKEEDTEALLKELQALRAQKQQSDRNDTNGRPNN